MEQAVELVNEAGRWFTATVPRLALEVSFLVLLLLLLDRFLRGRVQASLRHAIWLLLLVKLALPLSLALPTSPLYWLPEAGASPSLLLPLEPHATGEVAAFPAADLPGDPSPPFPPAPTPLPAAATTGTTGPALSLGGLLFLAWVGVVLGLATYQLRRQARVLALAAGGSRPQGRVGTLFRRCLAEAGMGGRVSLRLTRPNHTPFACGLFRPLVAVPADLAAVLDEEALRGVLHHEIAHIRRHDPAVGLVQSLLLVLHFFNPLLWVANRRIRQVREEAVDEMVLVRIGEEDGMYERTLLAVARHLVAFPVSRAVCPGTAEWGSSLGARIEHMGRRPRPHRVGPGWSGGALVALLGLMLLPMGMAQGDPGGGKGGQEPAGRENRPGGATAGGEEAGKKATAGTGVSAMVRQGLLWLARNQEKEGNWHRSLPHSVGETGLALMALMAGGSTPAKGPYRSNLARGIAWLLEQEQGKGLIGERNCQSHIYSHLAATIALCRAYRLSPDLELRSPVQRALGYISSCRNPRKGWRYHCRSGDNDTSVTTWAVMALCEARRCGKQVFKVAESDLAGAASWFADMTDEKTGRTGYLQRGGVPARNRSLVERFPPELSEATTAAALHSSFLMGSLAPGNPLLRKQVDLLLARPPLWDEEKGTIDLYYWFFGTLAMHRAARTPGLAARWLEWKKKLVLAARRGFSAGRNQAGPWGRVTAWGYEGGPVYTTSMMVLALSHCIGSLPVAEGGAGGAEEEDAQVAAILAEMPAAKAATLMDAWLPGGRDRVIAVLQAMAREKAKAIVAGMKKAKGPAFAPFRE